MSIKNIDKLCNAVFNLHDNIVTDMKAEQSIMLIQVTAILSRGLPWDTIAI
jgi:hypothetical protein